VNGTVDDLVAVLDLAADEDEHFNPSVVLLDDHVADALAWPDDHPQLQTSRFTLAAAKAGTWTPKVDDVAPWIDCGHAPSLRQLSGFRARDDQVVADLEPNRHDVTVLVRLLPRRGRGVDCLT
jgi:hypothetical protein